MWANLAALLLALGGCQGYAPVTNPAVIESRTQSEPVSGESVATTSSPDRQSNGLQGVPHAVVVLYENALRQSAARNLQGAATSLERAIRIAPREAELYVALAQVRVDQNEAEQASQLCRKAVALAAGNPRIGLGCRRILSGN